MYKKGIVLAVSVLVCALYAQGGQYLEKEDILQAFEQYNASALENAKADQVYGEILQELLTTYKMPNTIENQAEMIALVKNFDNSLQLHALSLAYQEGRTLQLASGASLETLDANIEQAVEVVLQDVYRNTLEAKKIQIELYKQKIKEVKKDEQLTAAQKKEQVAQWKGKIKQIKQESRTLKKNASVQIENTARQYMNNIQSEYEKAQAKQLEAVQSNTHNVKANHKKPVAK